MRNRSDPKMGSMGTETAGLLLRGDIDLLKPTIDVIVGRNGDFVIEAGIALGNEPFPSFLVDSAGIRLSTSLPFLLVGFVEPKRETMAEDDPRQFSSSSEEMITMASLSCFLLGSGRIRR